MNYQRIHDQIIDHAKTRTLGKEIYTEKHHIIPKSMNGMDVKENLVRLTAREHYLIHWLLYMIYRTLPMAYAWHAMKVANHQMNGQRYTSHTFEYLRRNASIVYSGKNNPMYGKTHSEETRLKMSQNKRGRPAWNKGLKCPTEKSSWNKGIPCSEEVKRKITEKNTGSKRSEETKKKQSLAAIGKVKSETAKLNMSIAARSKKSTCIHCNFTSNPSSITRYHNENCKYKYNILEV